MQLKIEEFGLICLLWSAVFCSNVDCVINNIHEGCQDLLEEFAADTGNFTQCTIQHARPIKVCLVCVNAFMEVLERYKDILKLHDESGNACKLELINVDRLEVVEASYNFVVNLWNRASCNNCFKNVTNSITDTKNNETDKFLKLYDDLNACISNESNSSKSVKCDKCKNDYLNLNEFYNNNKASVHGFCMDIIDAMNTTRITWSQDFGCCSERESPELVFVVSASIFCCIPLIFYLFARLCVEKHLLPLSTPKRWEQYLTASSSASNMVPS